jgi:hypothetical protein
VIISAVGTGKRVSSILRLMISASINVAKPLFDKEFSIDVGWCQTRITRTRWQVNHRVVNAVA